MSRLLVEHETRPEIACPRDHVRQAGYTDAEISACYDDARALIRGKPSRNRWMPPGRLYGMLMAKQARAIGERLRRPSRTAPVARGEHA